jgi:ribonucleoside-diphosphate reductase alpha chain
VTFDLAAFRASLLTDPLIQGVWRDKYRFNEETCQADTQRRVVDALYANDPSAEAKTLALELMLAGHLIPAGRIMAGAGTGRAVTLLNCYVNETVQDSMPGVQRAISRAAFTMQQGGGIGTDWSTVRPNGAVVRRTGSVSSGVLPFMDQMDAMCRTVSSAGTRRGAMMGTLRDDHPDLLDFIRAKRTPGRLTQFNVSVLVSDALMTAVKNDKTWDLGFHVPRADGLHTTIYNAAAEVWDRLDVPFPYDVIEWDNEYAAAFGSQRGEVLPWYIYRRVRARDLWDELMRSTYTYAEPGVIFIDRVNSWNNLRYCETIRATNPCFTGDTKVWTIDGPQKFSDLAATGKAVPVLTELVDGKLAYRLMTNPRLTQRRANLVKITFSTKRGKSGHLTSTTTLRCTPTHEFFKRNGEPCRAEDLQCGDGIESAYRNVANQKGYIGLRATAGDRVMEHHLTAEYDHGRRPVYPLEHGHHTDGVKDHNVSGNVEIKDGGRHNAEHLSGENNPMRRWYPNATIEERQRYHDNMSAATTGDRNGMSGRKHRTDTLEKIGNKTRDRFEDPEFRARHSAGVRAANERRRINANHRVVSVEIIEEMEDVYCGTVADTGRFFVSLGDEHYEGVLVSNCGEQPLPPNGACNLGSVNLAGMVQHPFTDHAGFDNQLYHRTIRAAIRLLDNVLDVATYPLLAQAEEARLKRRVGLGVTGFADMLLQMGVAYGSDESVKIAEKLSWNLREASYVASATLAKERGAFPLYEADRIQESPNVKGLSHSTKAAIGRYGLRNGVLNTIAPNGTITLAFALNTGSGGEPVFAFEKNKRRVRQPDDTYLEYESINYSYRLYEAIRGCSYLREELPSYFVGAMDIAPADHVRVQAAWQRHVDSAISKTVNCPTDLDYETFKTIYAMAYDQGCKGCTTYRYDPAAGRGSVLSLTEEPTVSAEDAAPVVVDEPVRELIDAAERYKERKIEHVLPRPARVDGSTYKIKWPLTGVNWYVTVTRSAAGEPLELFIATRETDQQEWVQALSCTLTAILRRGGDFRFLIQELKMVTAATGAAFLQIGDDAEHPVRYPSVVAAIGGVIEAETRRLSEVCRPMEVTTDDSRRADELIGAVTSVQYENRGFDEVGNITRRRAHAIASRVLDCPVCGTAPMIHESGCRRCLTCGHEECG